MSETQQARAARLAAALRDNLRKRKARAREIGAAAGGDPAVDGEDRPPG